MNGGYSRQRLNITIGTPIRSDSVNDIDHTSPYDIIITYPSSLCNADFSIGAHLQCL